MANKKPIPIITHTEILVRCLRNIEQEISVWEDRLNGLPDVETKFQAATADLREKLEAVKEIYRIETGIEYC